MKRRRVIFPSIVLAVVVMSALGCDVLSPSPTPTPTRAPTATPTLTPTTTHTPRPTATPTITPTPESSIAGIVLALEDLPPGFEATSLEEYGLTREALSGGGLVVEAVFAFVEYEHFELVMGFTTLLPTRLDQASFDAELGQPDYLIESFVLGLGGADILEQSQLAGLDDIGDASAGLTVVSDTTGIPMRMDMVVFRRDVVGVFLITMYLDGDVPVIPIADLARIMDDRVAEMLPIN